LIATYHTHGPAIALSKGLDRDRGVDESGNQLVVFGRRGGRPFNHEEMQRMYLRDGKLFTVTDGPPEGGKEIAFREAATKPAAAEAPQAPQPKRPAPEQPGVRLREQSGVRLKEREGGVRLRGEP
jgi:hypothetical protein